MIRIYIGTEPSQWLACEVLKSSIRRRTVTPVQFVESWTRENGWLPDMVSLPTLKNGTAFNTFRWLVPALARNGTAIYLDADQVVLSDIADLAEWVNRYRSDPERQFVRFCAVCDAVGSFGKKTPEPGKVQTSVMAMDVSRCQWDAREMVVRVANGHLAYRDLMQATWIPRDEIGELPPEWNHFNLCERTTKLVHFSHVASQPWKSPKNPVTHIWEQELRLSLNAGHIKMSDIEHEVWSGHVASVFLKRLETTSL